jgi:LuxR family maltose regulon positive regulatory protein
MAIPVTRTKVILPRRRPDLLSRRRLLDILIDLMDYKLVIIAAPAGYGKTSLLIDFAHYAELPVCWYSIDSLDQSPQRFMSHFIAAITQKYPSFGTQSRALLEASNPANIDLDRVVAAIVNEAYENIREHFLLILDDYHLVNETKEISYFISRFTQEIDENCHVILSSRTLLALPDMPLMVARTMVGGLSFEELAFQADEIQSLVMQNFNQPMPEQVAEELAEITEGWITGLLLSTQANWHGMTDRIRLARVSRVGLYDYLAQQVLDQQPPDVRNFLLRTSFLEEFDVHLCEEVLGSVQNWQHLFEVVLLSNLFVLPVGEDGKWIRYHHLFRDFLQACLAQDDPLEKDTILRRLTSVYAAREEWEKAYATSQHLGDWETQANLIETAGPALIRNSQLTTLAQWIDAIPSVMLAIRPNLLSLRAVPDIVHGQVERGLKLLNQAELSLREANDCLGLARTLVRRATAYRFMGKHQRALDDANDALQLTEGDPELRILRAEALRGTGVSLYQLGRVKEALDHLTQALNAYTDLNDRQNVVMMYMELGLAHMESGQYRQALTYNQQALEYWREVKNTTRQANLLNNLGVLSHLMGDYEQAVATFEEALLLARQNGYLRMEGYILCSIGDLYGDLEAIESALEAYQQAREIASRIDYKFILLYAELGTAARYRALHNLSQAHFYLETAAQYLNKDSGPFELGFYQCEVGRLALAEGKKSEALLALTTAAQRFEEAEQKVEAARVYLYQAVAQNIDENIDQALKALDRAFQLASSLESHHVLVVAGKDARALLEITGNKPYNHHPSQTLLHQVTVFQRNISSLRKRLRPRVKAIPFAPPKLTIQAFGRTQVEKDGKPVGVPEWQNQRRVRELFFYLLTYPKGRNKEEIGLTFWPESSTSQLKLQFKNAIYRLRHALGPDIVLFDETHYWFNKNQDYQYDVEDFTNSISEAQQATLPQKKIPDYQKAIKLYQGAFLPEAEGSWVWAERQRLREMYLEGTLELARLLYETGDYASVLDYCQRILDEDPCLEEAYRLAMLVYAARGNRAGVNRQFERCRLALLREVNASPSAQTMALFESLIR